MLATNQLLLLIILAGVGTYLLRLLPFYLPNTPKRHSLLVNFSAAIAPAAVAVLWIATAEPMIWQPHSLWLLPLGFLATAATYYVSKGVALPTLVGAGVYGIAHHFFC